MYLKRRFALGWSKKISNGESGQALLTGCAVILRYSKISLMKSAPRLSPEEIDRIIEMAWEDRTSFDAIRLQFGLTQGEVEKLMRRELRRSSFELWRKRVSSGVGVKHALHASPAMKRFKSTRQRAISGNAISKRRGKR